jgi:hypothetical protein
MNPNELNIAALGVCQPHLTLPDYASAAYCGGLLTETNNIGWTNPLTQSSRGGIYTPLTTSQTTFFKSSCGITALTNQNDSSSISFAKPYDTNVFGTRHSASMVNTDINSTIFGTNNKLAGFDYTSVLAQPKDKMVFAAGTTNNFIVGISGLSDLVVGAYTNCMFTKPNQNIYIATGANNNYTTSNYSSSYLSTTAEFLVKNDFNTGATALNVGSNMFSPKFDNVFGTSVVMDRIGSGSFAGVKATLSDWYGTKKDDLCFGLTHSAAIIQSAMTPVFKAGGDVLSLLGQLKDNFKAEHFGFNYKETDKQIIINLYITVSGDVTGKYAHLGNNNYYNI